jgi:hypothetical protein
MDKNKLYLSLGLIIAIAMCLYLSCSLISIKKSLDLANATINSYDGKMKQMEDSIIRSQSILVTNSQMEKYLSNLGLDGIKKDIEKLNNKLESVNVVLVKTPGYIGKGITSTGQKPSGNPEIPSKIPCTDTGGGVITCANPDKFNYLNKEQELSLNETFSSGLVPFGKTSFKAWEEKPWNLQVFPRSYIVKNVVSENEEGETIIYNKFEIEVEGKKYPIDINSSTTVQEPKSSEFWFNPKLYLGTGVGVVVNNEVRAEVVPSVEISFFSYGPNKKHSEWSLLNIGLGAHTQQVSPVVTISPVNYNVGDPLPLLDNLFVGPSIGVDVDGNVSITGGIKVGL